MLNEEGYKNIIRVAKDYSFNIDEKFINENIEALSKYFAKSDDPTYLMNFPNDEPWWTFENEANSGGISDTYPRDKLVDNLALVILGMEWPIYSDSFEYHEKFRELLDAYYLKGA